MKDNKPLNRTVIEIGSYFVLGLAILAFVFSGIDKPVSSRIQKTQKTIDPLIGNNYPVLDSLLDGSASYGLFLTVSPTCYYCNSSLPFYVRLSKVVQEVGNIDIHALVALESQELGQSIAYRDSGISNIEIKTINYERINISFSYKNIYKCWLEWISEKTKGKFLWGTKICVKGRL